MKNVTLKTKDLKLLNSFEMGHEVHPIKFLRHG